MSDGFYDGLLVFVYNYLNNKALDAAKNSYI